MSYAKYVHYKRGQKFQLRKNSDRNALGPTVATEKLLQCYKNGEKALTQVCTLPHCLNTQYPHFLAASSDV